MKTAITRARLIAGLSLVLFSGRALAEDPRRGVREAIARGDVETAAKMLRLETGKYVATKRPPSLETMVDLQNLFTQIDQLSGLTMIRQLVESEADDAYLKARAVPSREAFEAVLRLDPKHRQARRALAMMDAADGKWSEAKQAFEALVAENPADVEARDRFAFALLRNRDVDAALGQWAAALEANPGHADSWAWCGKYWLDCSLLESAETALRKALALDPCHWQAQEALIETLAAQRKFTEAKELRERRRAVAAKLPKLGDRILVAQAGNGSWTVREALLDSLPWRFRIEHFDQAKSGRKPIKITELRRDGEAWTWGDVVGEEFKPTKPVKTLPELEQVLEEAK